MLRIVFIEIDIGALIILRGQNVFEILIYLRFLVDLKDIVDRKLIHELLSVIVTQAKWTRFVPVVPLVQLGL